MGLCKLCENDRVLVRSHIIPKAFHLAMEKDANFPGATMMSSRGDAHPRRQPGGVYDDGILCGPCEERFGPWDTYGAEYLIQNFDRDATPVAGAGSQIVEYRADAWDEKRLRMFVLSVLWRAAVTTHKFFEPIDLGPHESRLRQCILAADPGDPDDFSVLLMRWYTRLGNEATMKFQLPLPTQVKFDGINVANILFGGGGFTVKLDGRRFPAPYRARMLCPGRPVYFAAICFDDSPAAGLVTDALLHNRNRKRGRR